jgi:hypothetical protein
MKTKVRSILAATVAVIALLPPRHAAAIIAADLIANSSLTFGRLVATATAGAVTVSPSGARTSSGGVVLGSAFGASAAAFTVNGQPNAGYTIMLPSSCALSGGGGAMTVDTFLSGPANGQNLVGSNGTASFTVGATLHVGASQSSASYSGSCVVMIAYD